MSYVAQTLAPNEEIVKRADFNWTYNFSSWFFFFLGLTPTVVFALGCLATNISFADLGYAWVIALASFLFGLLQIVIHYVILHTTEIVITTFRFVYKTGLISRKSNEVSLNKIEEISLEQSVMGRIFGFGQLILRGTGVGVITLPNIDNPVQLRRVIEGAKAKMRSVSIDERTGDAD